MPMGFVKPHPGLHERRPSSAYRSKVQITLKTPGVEIRQTEAKGRGVFTRERIAQGEPILEFQGKVLKTAELTDDLLAMQIGPDEWLCSDGSLLDDCVNHSCEPNAGFSEGTPVLFALCDIAAGEEIGWDYSTSIGEPDWTLECRCNAPTCRIVVRAWPDLKPAERERLRRLTLAYLRKLINGAMVSKIRMRRSRTRRGRNLSFSTETSSPIDVFPSNR